VKTVRIPDLGDLHSKIATDVWPDGAILKCMACTHTERITSTQAAGFLRRGWPSHCDRTMQCDKAPALTAMGQAALDPEAGA